jgi:hypothetical protein
VKILFDATKAETAGNADWVIDADTYNLGYSNGPAVAGTGSEANPQQVPTPSQSGINAGTSGTYWSGGISSWGVDMVKKGFIVETLPYNGQITFGNLSNPHDLSNYKVFVVCEPNIVFTASEKTAILNFVNAGGGLFMISDHDVSDRNGDNWDSPHIWNDLMSNNNVHANPFGITFDYANFSETTTNIPALPSDSLLHGPMGNVTEVQWNNGTSMTLDNTQNSTVKGIVYKTGSSFGNTNVMVAHALYGNGRVAALGDSSPADDGTGDPNDALYDGWITDAAGNHEKLIVNTTIWLAGNIVTGLTDKSNSSFRFNYTNPCYENCVFTPAQLSGTNEDVSFYLFDIRGSQVKKLGNVNMDQFSFSTEGIQPGMYFFSFRKNGRDMGRGKIVLGD